MSSRRNLRSHSWSVFYFFTKCTLYIPPGVRALFFNLSSLERIRSTFITGVCYCRCGGQGTYIPSITDVHNCWTIGDIKPERNREPRVLYENDSVILTLAPLCTSCCRVVCQHTACFLCLLTSLFFLFCLSIFPGLFFLLTCVC